MNKNVKTLPPSGFAIEIDGRIKSELETIGATAGARKLKARFPNLQIRVYDAYKQPNRHPGDLIRSAQRLLSGLPDLHIRVVGIRSQEPECRSSSAYLQKKRPAPKDSAMQTPLCRQTSKPS